MKTSPDVNPAGAEALLLLLLEEEERGAELLEDRGAELLEDRGADVLDDITPGLLLLDAATARLLLDEDPACELLAAPPVLELEDVPAPDVAAELLEEPMHSHAPYAVPSALHVWKPLRPSSQRHAVWPPGTHDPSACSAPEHAEPTPAIARTIQVRRMHHPVFARQRGPCDTGQSVA